MLDIKYLGHSAFAITSGQTKLLVDPFLTGNSTAAWSVDEAIAFAPTHILLTHGHDDHVGDTAAIAKATGATVVAMVELCTHLKGQGVENSEMANYGGTIDLGNGCAVTLVPAWHTSNPGTGAPAGLIITTPEEVVYHAGDTCIFGDMALIGELYKPTVGLIPVGGRFTMDGPTASLACRAYFKHFKAIVPIHYATFPIIAPTAEAFVQAAQGLPVQPLKPGESVAL